MHIWEKNIRNQGLKEAAFGAVISIIGGFAVAAVGTHVIRAYVASTAKSFDDCLDVKTNNKLADPTHKY